MSQVQRNLHTSGRLSDRCAHHSFHKQQRHAGGRVGGRKSAMNIGHACSSYQVYGNQRSTSSVTDITRCSLPTRAHELDKPRLIITRAAHDDFDEIDDFSSQNDDNLSDKERLQLVFNTALEDDLYLALGRAHCFAMNKGGGKLDEKIIVEPIGAAGLEAMSKGMATSYTHVFGSTLGHARKMLLDATENKDFQEHLPKEFQGAELAENFEARCEAATRTWDRPHPRETLMTLVPVGKVRGDFNFTTEGDNKRVLNVKHEVKDSDNIKQDMSIDVYGRGSEDDAKDKSAIADLYNV